MIFIFSFSYSQCEFNPYCKVVHILCILFSELTTFIYITLLSNIFIHYCKLLNVFWAESLWLANLCIRILQYEQVFTDIYILVTAWHSTYELIGTRKLCFSYVLLSTKCKKKHTNKQTNKQTNKLCTLCWDRSV